MIFEGPQKCSEWLNSFIVNRRKNLAYMVDEKRRLIQKAQSAIRVQEGGPLEYNETEMDGIADNYSYNAIDIAQPKSFMTIGDEDKHNIITFQNKSGKEEKISSDLMKKQMITIENARNADNQKFAEIMEKSQIEAVINNANL
jgi:hypothetical protein